MPRDCHPATLAMRQRNLRKLESDDRLRAKLGAQDVTAEEYACQWYPTPAAATQAILPHLTAATNLCPERLPCILEPAAGRGDIAFELALEGYERAQIECIDINPAHVAALAAEGYGAHREDTLLWAAGVVPRYDLVITNPPFDLWCDFALALLPILRPGGTLCLLARAQHLWGQARAARLWTQHPPTRIYFQSFRAQFVAGGDNPDDVAWVTWIRGQAPQPPVWLERGDG